jgi:hypothetical protein
LNVLCIRIFHFISKSETLVDILEEKEYKLKAKGVVCGDNTSLVSALVASIKGRFDDVLEDELAATQIACLRNWPVQLTAGTKFTNDY